MSRMQPRMQRLKILHKILIRDVCSVDILEGELAQFVILHGRSFKKRDCEEIAKRLHPVIHPVWLLIAINQWLNINIACVKNSADFTQRCPRFVKPGLESWCFESDFCLSFGLEAQYLLDLTWAWILGLRLWAWSPVLMVLGHLCLYAWKEKKENFQLLIFNKFLNSCSSSRLKIRLYKLPSTLLESP